MAFEKRKAFLEIIVFYSWFAEIDKVSYCLKGA